MKLKRSIIITLIYCMGIGGFTFFIGALYPIDNTDGVAETMNIKNESQNTDEVINTHSASDDTTKRTTSTALASTAMATPIPSPTTTATPTPPPVYELIKGGNADIEKFFSDYYVAWNSCDYSLIKTLTTDSENAIPLLDLQKETRFIDDIRDISCYIMKSYEEDAYIVYVYYEIKYVNIKTSLPRLDKYYLVKDTDDTFKIYNTEMDEMLKTYFEDRDQDDKVKEIIQMTKEKSKEALNSDVHLRVYVEALYNN